MIGSQSTQVIENLANPGPPRTPGIGVEEDIDWTDLRQALDGCEVQKAQQKLVAAQRQCQNGVPPKQLLLYLVRLVFTK